MRKIRRKRGRSNRKHKVFICLIFISLLLMLSYGYALFSTNVQIDVTGKTKKLYVSDAVKKMSLKDNVTMITDPFGNIRYTGPSDDVHNYICLVNENPCQDKNLFRIIGSFLNIDDGNGKTETRVKVIRATEYSQDYWDTSGSNNWARPATLNTTLNTTYYDSLDSKAQSVIGNAVWNLGAWVNAEVTSLQAYESERGEPYENNSSFWTGKIALMYPSDYGYASSECYGGSTLLRYYDNTNCNSSDWLFYERTSDEYFLSPGTFTLSDVFFLDESGYVRCTNQIRRNQNLIRPTFYLKSNTLLVTKNHNGTLLNPYVVKLDE